MLYNTIGDKMFILKACDNSSLLNTILFIKNIINIIFIVVPIILALLFSIDLAKNVFSKDDNDSQNNLRLGIKRIIYSLILLLVPTIIEAFMNMIDDYSKVADCYTIATEEKVQELHEKEEEEYDEKRKEELEKREEQKQKVAEEQAEAERRAKEAEEQAAHDAQEGSSGGGSSTYPVSSDYIKSNCRMAHATSSIIKKPHHHPPGDQAGKKSGGEGNEVFTTKYHKGWTYVARLKDAKKANLTAACMQKVALNNHVGYDRSGSKWKALWNEASKVNWDVTKVTKDTTTSCCPCISVCLRAAGVKSITPGMGCSNAQSIKKALAKTGEFEFFSDSKHTQTCNNLKRGDILIKTTHAALAL